MNDKRHEVHQIVRWTSFFIILLLYNAICLFYPLCCHFGIKRNSRLIGSCQDYMSHVTSFIIGVGRRNRKRGESIGPHRAPMYRRRFFGLVLYARWAMRFNVDIVAFCDVRDTGHTFPEVDTDRTRVNYSYAYAKLPKVFAQFHWRRARTSVVQPEQLCMRSEVRL